MTLCALIDVNEPGYEVRIINKLISISIPLNMVWELELVLVLGIRTLMVLPHLLLWVGLI